MRMTIVPLLVFLSMFIQAVHPRQRELYLRRSHLGQDQDLYSQDPL